MKEYDDSISFWNSHFEDDEFYKECKYPAEDLDTEVALVEDMISFLAKKENLLDYGCGDGWCTFKLLNAGAKHVTALEATQAGINAARTVAQNRGDLDKLELICGMEDKLSDKENFFDGFISVNVLDVVPENVARNILAAIKKSLKPGAEGMLLFNPLIPAENLEKTKAVLLKDENGNELPKHYAINGVIRIVNRTSEEWTAFLSQYLDVEYLGEVQFKFEEAQNYHRRLFRVKK